MQSKSYLWYVSGCDHVTYECDDLYLFCSKWQYREPALIVWLYCVYTCTYSYTVALSPGLFSA